MLVANRGEIALRIVRACTELEIESLALYSEVDRYSLHVKRATNSVYMGSKAIEPYLDIERIITVAREKGCDAVHPGYGFLSENADFAERCHKAGLIFIGPNSEVIRKMGSKIAARAAMKKAGLPVIPGSEGSLKSLSEAKRVALEIGYPVMLKATYGGGGRGIRLCTDDKSLESAYPRVQSEALKSFGNGEVFMEKFIASPRHIEVQILADNFSNVVHLYERDCSIQRRHQKLIEIAPAPNLDKSLRKTLYDYAIKAAKAVNYQNAGTVEFVLDKQNNPYFLEMNTRLQVEHPITEQITGIDIVQQQLLIASQRPLGFKQSQVQCHGFSMEFRVNAEDPKNDFLPSFGKITKYYAPGGPGVRTDSAIYTGYTIPPDFDSLCAKLSVWALDWPSLLNRARRSLEEMRLYGVKTTIPYYLEILNNKEFKNAHFDVGFVESHPELTAYSQKKLPHNKALVLAAVISAYSGL